jgi:TorA maturation chaperone TorD
MIGQEIFQLRSTVYAFLTRCLREEPDSNLVADLCDGEIVLNFPSWVESEGIRDAQKYADDLVEYFAEKSPANLLVELKDVYVKLFLGPGKLMAPPWESVYLNSDGLTFGPQTIDVRKFYARHGLEINNIHHEPDDHIAYELEFYARLCEKMQAALMERDRERCVYLSGEMKRFLDEHLMRWIHLFKENVVNNDPIGFYSWVVSMANGLLEGDIFIFNQVSGD